MTFVIIGLILFFIAGASSVLAIGLRNMPQPTISMPAPRLARIERPKLVQPIKRDATFAQERTELIKILLDAGKSPRFIARQLTGSTRYNRERVRLIQDMTKTV